MKPAALRFGPISPRAVHLCVDMQNMFAEATPWHTPWMARVLPVVEEIARRHAAQTVFTRFIPARDAEEARGSWRRYYRRWAEMTVARIEPGLLELVPALARLVPPAATVDKRVYSPFFDPGLLNLLRERRADGLVVTGGETDVCVLATVIDAVDIGFRVVLVTDALCSASDRTHDALLTLYRERFSEQIETADAETILAQWNADE
ncbi:MAG TPA: cysteine hydrolase [Stellaceae bacterium]|nr:cysteine hydrolase [Stellaceae bacterium]